MDKKQLAIALSKLHPLEKLNITLEQYQTESELAADLLWTAHLHGDIKGKIIADLGCGNGILGVGALLLGAENVYFIDIDTRALALAKNNAHGKGAYYNIDVNTFHEEVDTVIMNPPFGVQQRKADKAFLETAMQLSTTVYSIHKIESKRFIASLARDHHWHVETILEKEFLIKKSYTFHTQKNHPVRVGIWILRKKV